MTGRFLADLGAEVIKIEPPGGCTARHLPPFAEEMNHSRRMATLQAHRLAALGIDVLVVDLFGTGDSAGDFADARWETWQEDAKAAVAWLGRR